MMIGAILYIIYVVVFGEDIWTGEVVWGLELRIDIESYRVGGFYSRVGVPHTLYYTIIYHTSQLSLLLRWLFIDPKRQELYKLAKVRVTCLLGDQVPFDRVLSVKETVTIQVDVGDANGGAFVWHLALFGIVFFGL